MNDGTSNRVKVVTSKGAVISVKENTSSKVRLGESGQTFFRNGHSPYIDENTGTWWVYDDKQQKYVDTYVLAEMSKIDDELSLTSTNPVQNKVVTKEVNDKVDEEDIKELKAIDIDVLWEAL